MTEKEFLVKVDELYESYKKTNQGDADAIFFEQDLYELVIEYKEGEEL